MWRSAGRNAFSLSLPWIGAEGHAGGLRYQEVVRRIVALEAGESRRSVTRQKYLVAIVN
jgi:hypothetical protein